MLNLKRSDLCRLQFIFLFILVIFISKDVLGANTIIDSDTYDCGSGATNNITDSVINHSTVECVNMTNSNIFYSTVRSSIIRNMQVNFADVDDGVLVSGQIKYGDYTYYGPFSIQKIYDGVKPFSSGSLDLNVTSVGQGGSVLVTYFTSDLGYTVTLDASSIAPGQTSVSMTDDGQGADVLADDGIYTAEVTATESGTSSKTLLADLDDNRGNEWELTEDIFLDNTAPDADIYISDMDENKDSDETDSRTVILYLNYSDNVAVDKCRFANSLSELDSATLENCQNTRPWQLSPFNGEKTVYFQVFDEVGNNVTVSDTIELDVEVVPAPVVYDGVYSGSSDSLDITWEHEDGVDASEATYEVRVYNSSTKDDTTNISRWVYTEDDEITISGLSLEDGMTYYAQLRCYSGAVTTSDSDGVTIDRSAPADFNMSSNVVEGSWVSSDSVVFNFSAFDAESGIEGYSYSLSTSSSQEPDELLEVQDNPASATFENLGEGIFYFKVKGKNGAGLWSDTKNFTLYLDNTRPSIPRLINPNSSGEGNVNFNWDASQDPASGIDEYNILISTDEDFDNIIVNDTTSSTSYSYESDVDRIYHAKVRALNGVGLWSYFSDRYGEQFDATPPGFIYKTPQGKVSEEKVFMALKTDEDASCFYRNKSAADMDYTRFFYTGDIMHEHKMKLGQGTHSFEFLCKDKAGNQNMTDISFTVDEESDPSSLSVSVSELEGYVGEKESLELTLKDPSGNGYSNALPEMFKLDIGGKSIDDFSIIDKGAGEYELIFRMPDRVFTDEKLTIAYDDIQSSLISVSTKKVSLKARALIEGTDVDTGSLERMTFFEGDSYTLGLATNNPLSVLNSSGKNLELNKNSDQGFIYLFFTEPNSTIFRKRDKLLQRHDFESKLKPSFGYHLDEDYIARLILDYSGIVLSGKDFSPRGRYSVVVKNQDLVKGQDKINVTVSIS